MTRRTQIFGIVALAYLVVAASALGWVAYRVEVNGQELKDRVDAIADKNAKVKTYTEFSKLIEETETERSLLASHVLAEDNTSSFLTEIETLAANVGVTLFTRSLQVSDKKKSSFDDLVIVFDVTGPEVLVKNLLTILETLPYHSQVSSLTFTRGESGVIEGTIEVKVSLLQNDK
jgi:hypothetical protein